MRVFVSMKDLKLIGFKSHDCHVSMQQLQPVAICGILPKNVRVTIILCKLEMYFPPSFFDNTVHLIVYLVKKIRCCGLVYLRWMYPIEPYMKIFKGYTHNHHRTKALIVERYIIEEPVEFFSNYLSEAKSIEISKSHHVDRYGGRGGKGLNVISMHLDIFLQTHLYILNNVDEVEPYLSTHKRFIKEKYPRMSEK
ncbi:hypothetical protein KIW84_036185 [Lathyrus oleraceus]|uniref:DUF4218 domain-containing protein n=1 Tax=Pisum sativum TaxID=3888 RepID=A0A9D4Y3Z5_PEA|nr:hypothetical protein KIW84_036185 [Pisum sativum]